MEWYQKQRSRCHQLCLVAILFCTLIYYYMDFILDYAVYKEHRITEGYFVNTTGCHMLALSPLPPAVLPYMTPQNPVMCPQLELLHGETIEGTNYLTLTMTEEQILSIYGVESLSEIKCTYTTIRRYSDRKNEYPYSKKFTLSNETRHLPLSRHVNMVRIKCERDNNDTIYHDVHFFLPKPQPRKSRSKRLSVMILGIDSISHMHFLRSMPQLASYIEKLPHIEFWGYNRVGRNSYPNLVPLLSGLSEDELEAACMKGKKNFDSCDLIWKHYKAAGYNTSFGEDSSVIGTFVYCKPGFNRQPTDFYLRPVILEMRKHTYYSSDDREIYCSGERKFRDVLIEFIHKLVPHMQLNPHFSFFWSTQGVHEIFSYVQLLDFEYLRLLEHFEKQGIFNNTLILLMSDHGDRFGSFRNTHQGMVEESQPLLIAIYPEWLAKDYPLAMGNLRSNAHSLLTTYDLHATLMDLLELKLLEDQHVASRTVELNSLDDSQLPRGISLFLPIPKSRDCEMAGIPAHFCLCNKMEELAIEDSRAQRAARFVVRSINSQLKTHTKCQSLKLETVIVAYLLQREVDRFEFEVKVRLKTLPGGGLFEGTTRFTGYDLALDGVVTRANKYGNQSYCVNDYRIEMYCYCL